MTMPRDVGLYQVLLRERLALSDSETPDGLRYGREVMIASPRLCSEGKYSVPKCGGMTFGGPHWSQSAKGIVQIIPVAIFERDPLAELFEFLECM